MSDRGSLPVIAASELGQHAFCARSWWLERVKGQPSAHWQEMASGRAAHEAHGRVVVRYHELRRWGYVLLLAAVLMAVAGTVLLARGW
jgi:hypothetical protein